MRYVNPPGPRRVLRSDEMPGVYRDAEYEVNALGLRGRLPSDADQTRTLVVGGSAVEDCALADEDSWCGQLERRLGRGAWVGNMGRAGMRLQHATVQLEEMLPRLPRVDRVVVLAGLNDMLCDCGLHMARGAGADAFGHADGVDLPGDAPRESDLGALVARLKARRRLVEPGDLVHDARVDREALARFSDAARDVRAAIESAGAEPVLATQPAVWADEDAAATHLYAGGVGPVEGWFADPRCPYYAPALLDRLLGYYNHALAEMPGRCVDLAAIIPAARMLFYDDFHFSVAGAAAVSSIVADHLTPRAASRSARSAPASIYPLW